MRVVTVGTRVGRFELEEGADTTSSLALRSTIIILGRRSGRILPLRQRYTAHWDAQSKAGTRTR